MEGLDFLLLGPVEARHGGRALPLGRRRQRSVLAQLLLNAGRVVSAERLIEAIWDDSPPVTAATALHGYVSQLRKALEPAEAADLIVTRDPGYLIAIEPEQLDLTRFELLQTRAHSELASGNAGTALALLDEALALWRGTPLEDLAGLRFADEAARRLDELRLTALEERFDACLALGRARELVPELESVIAAEPLREHLRGQLMLALYRSGRQADALLAYDEARRALVEQLGIQPGSSLRRLHQQMLEQDPALDGAPGRASGEGPRTGFRAFLLSDIRGYSSFSARRGDEAAAALADRFSVVAGGVIARFDGASIGNRGDEILAAFESPRQALRAAVALQEELLSATREDPSLPMPAGIGLDVGEAVMGVDGYQANAINIAARLCSLAAAGEILATRELVHLAQALDGVRYSPRPPARLKGIHDPVAAIRVSSETLDTERAFAELGRRHAEAPPVHRRRPGRLVLVAAGAVLAGTAALIFALTSGGGSSRPLTTANSLAVISPASDEVERSVPVGGAPSDVTVGGGAAWAINADDQTVTRVDSATHRVRTFGTGGIPLGLAFGNGSLWVANGSRARAQFVGPVVTSISRLDPDSAAVLATVTLPAPHGPVSNQSEHHVAVGDHAVWAINPDATVTRIDPASNRLAATIRDVNARALASSPDETWAIELNGDLARLSPVSDTVLRHVRVPAGYLSSIAVGGGAVWATDPYQGALWRIDPGPGAVERTIPLDVGVSEVAYGDGGVWAANPLRGTLSRVDPRTNRVTKTVQLGDTPGPLAIGEGAVWQTVAGAAGRSIEAAAPGNAGVAALPASVCGRVFFGGGGKPQKLIVSDLPLRGAPDLPVQQMSSAIAFVLREHGFRAGRFRIGYQSCDDSTSQTSIFDDRKCVANAKAWVRNPLVVGVVGPYNSTCAENEIPIANRGGPLGMISPTNSESGLTHSGPLTEPDLPGRLYPTGTRNFTRLYTSEDLQGAGAALFAKQRGMSPVFVLDDGGYGAPMASGFRGAARRLGLTVAGSSSWDPRKHGYIALAERVARSRARAVYVAGLLDSNGGGVIAALRRTLGGALPIVANDGFLPIAGLFDAAGPAARGVYVTTAAVPDNRLGLVGRKFVTSFGATQHGVPVDHAAVYAAQATEVMLDSIARSDGSRASVARALLSARVRGGILGSFGFDSSGDPTVTPVTVVRAAQPGGVAAVESVDGADVVAVVAPPKSLIR